MHAETALTELCRLRVAGLKRLRSAQHDAFADGLAAGEPGIHLTHNELENLDDRNLHTSSIDRARSDNFGAKHSTTITNNDQPGQ